MPRRLPSPRSFLLAVVAAASAAPPAPAVTLPGPGGGRIECLPPHRLLHASVESETRTYEFAGICTVDRNDTSTRIGYTIHGQWLPAERLALEVIEVKRTEFAAGRLTLKASCPDDPWLTGATCTLVTFLDPDGKPVPEELAAPPVPKSAGRLPGPVRLRLVQEVARMDSRPRPVVVFPSEKSTVRDVVEIVLEKPSGAPKEFPALYEYRLEWQNPVTKTWAPQPVEREFSLTSDGRKAYSAAVFINRGRYRLRARFAAPDRAKNPWSAWREFTIAPRP